MAWVHVVSSCVLTQTIIIDTSYGKIASACIHISDIMWNYLPNQVILCRTNEFLKLSRESW